MKAGGVQKWEQTETADTLNIYDISEMRTPILIVMMREETVGAALLPQSRGIMKTALQITQP